MAAPASAYSGSATASYTAAASDRHFASVRYLSKDTLTIIERTMAVWARCLNDIENQLHEAEKREPDSKDIAHDLEMLDDYKDLHETLCSHLESMGEDTYSYNLLLARDSKGEYQAIARYSIEERSNLYVGALISAPWNLRWRTPLKDLPSPLRGGGVLLMNSLFTIAKRDSVKILHLSSEKTAVGFYEKLGMKKTGKISFEFYPESEEHQAKMQSAMQRAFGKDFHYSLLLE